jgi:ABC-type multidrug transport system fused ATPase/permease subunit
MGIDASMQSSSPLEPFRAVLRELAPPRLRRRPEVRFLGIVSQIGPLAVAWWGLILLRGLLPPAFTLAVGALVGAAQRHTDLGTPLIVAGVVFLGLNTLGPVQVAVSADVGARTALWLRGRLVRACAGPEGLRHLEDPALADDLTRARAFDTGMGGPMLIQSVPPIADGLSQLLAGLIQAVILAQYRWWAAVIVSAGWLSTHFLLNKSSIWQVRSSPAIVQAERHSSYSYQLAVDSKAAKEIRIFGLADWVVDRFATHRRNVVDLFFKERAMRERPVRWAFLIIVLSNVLVFLSLGHDAVTGAVGLAAVVIFAQATAGITSLGYSNFDWWLTNAAEPIPNVLDLAGRMTSVGALPAGSRPADGMPATEIRLENVSFRYAESAPLVLDGLDLTIPAGTSLAIVGANGAGKTTLAKLLCRLYDPQRGAVLVDGVDIRQLDVDAWRGRIAAVFQDFIQYHMPLRDNVAPVGSAADDAVRQALERAGAGGLAELDTILNRGYDGGTDLSGGQWQRVALARAFYAVDHDAGVILLDEPTAQLDVRGEAEIFDRILTATRGRTTILISHRFSTVRHADRICVIEDGKVAELGSHEELMALGGRYRRMFDLQATRFLVEEADGTRAL